MTKMSSWYLNLKIRTKIMLFMISITTVLVVLINAITQIYFANVIKQNTYDRMGYTLEIIENSFRSDVSHLQENVRRMASTIEFSSLAKDIRQNDQTNFSNHYEVCQDLFGEFISSNPLINSVALIGKNNELYTLAKVGLNYDVSSLPFSVANYENDSSWSPVSQNPLERTIESTIALVYPVSFLYDSLVISSNTNEETILNIVVLLDATKLNDHFMELNKNTASTVVLADENFKAINVIDSEMLLENITYEETRNIILEKKDTQIFDYKNFNIAHKELALDNLNLVIINSEKQLLNEIAKSQQFTIFILFSAIVCAIISSIAVSKTITVPLEKLMLNIEKTKKGNVIEKILYPSKDEVGTINVAFYNMSKTIEKQIETIEVEKQLNLKREIDVLTRQINPHFLYNTLDCIRWEILKGNKSGAANMVEGLATFLRIGLNGTAQTHTIIDEINHANEYMKIMNFRQNSNINFVSHVEKGLEDYKVLKLILQPLVENAIKHAFDNNTVAMNDTKATVSVTVAKHEEHVIIEVSDNGKGIDINAAEKALKFDNVKKKSIGINNIYNRLLSFYGKDVTISFYSVPYYKNTVKISIP